ncbi:hypothetical protein [Mycobacterium lentiflavum]|uniref:Uncharacterized protein n=1 Tax=Mycobacterium lentiflavum TaxID=141349 RepID=A0ABY3USV0_MYCLN|nr:hypothetical protein [Mycobacterium lentiflavum]ULP41568.1 hypothetical protein MJO58_22365 [Mycobacterium lentiflavum]
MVRPDKAELSIDRLILGRRYIVHGANPEVVADLAGTIPIAANIDARTAIDLRLA